MKAFNIQNTKAFMSYLLGSEVFNDFLLEEATIKTFNTFNIDGRIIPEFYDDFEFGYEFSSWKDIKPVCFNLIKGKQLPVFIHFVMQLKPEKIHSLLSSKSTVDSSLIKSFTLNIKYLNGEISIITATAATTFILDKTPDEVWDSYVEEFLNKYNLI